LLCFCFSTCNRNKKNESQGPEGGHQLHFDLDERALLDQGEIRSPAVSAVRTQPFFNV
jgi:hypothetical protein